MKTITAVFAAAMMLLAPPAFAACPDVSGPYCLSTCWFLFEQAPSCAGTTGNVSSTTSSCYNNTPVLQFGTGSSSATYSFVLDHDYVSGEGDIELRFVEWNDPNASIYNTLTATISVTHNGTTTSQQFYSINGTQTNNCQWAWGLFSAQNGDTITVTVNTTINNSNVTARVGPALFYAYM